MLPSRYPAPQAIYPVEHTTQDLSLPLPPAMWSQFDVVTSVHLLCCAQSRSVLASFVRNAYAAGKPGSYFVSLTDNFLNTPDEYGCWEAFGFRKTTSASVDGDTGLLPEGSAVQYLFNGSSREVWIWHEHTYREAYQEAGFIDIELFGFGVPSKYLSSKKAAGIRNLILTPPWIGICARRPT